MVKPVIACFYTGGYSESGGYMHVFLDKINNNYIYEQCIPNTTRKRRKGANREIYDEYSGISAGDLTSVIYKNLQKEVVKDKFYENYYSGILIEDDLDGRYDSYSVEKIKKEQDIVRANISKIIKKNIPIYFLYAAPEIESWFIADWKNGFSNLFTKTHYFDDISKSIRNQFVVLLRKEINKCILNDSKLEFYATKSGEYKKLSEDFQKMIDDVNLDMYNKGIIDINQIRKFNYSKKIHGSYILREINPESVERVCDYFFQIGYLSLKNSSIEISSNK